MGELGYWDEGRLVRVQSSIALALRFFSVGGQEALAVDQMERARGLSRRCRPTFSVHRQWFLLAATGYTIPMGRNVRSITFFDLPYLASQVLTPYHHSAAFLLHTTMIVQRHSVTLKHEKDRFLPKIIIIQE